MVAAAALAVVVGASVVVASALVVVARMDSLEVIATSSRNLCRQNCAAGVFQAPSVVVALFQNALFAPARFA